MSNVFDPSKLNLDLNNPQKSEETKPSSSFLASEKEIKQSNSEIETDTVIKKQPTTPVENTLKVEPDVIDPLAEIGDKIPAIDEKVSKNTIIIDENSEIETVSDENTQEKAPEPKKEEPKQEETKIIDINIKTLDDLITYQNDKKYDFLTIEPGENEVQISFKKDSIEKEVKYIKFPIYNNILVQIKQATKLKVEVIDQEQEGKGTRKIKTKNFELLSKTMPTPFGEKIFLKGKEVAVKPWDKKKKKTSMTTILGFFASASFVSLVLGWAFITFIVLSAKSVEDVKFFYSLGINLNDINAFITKIITIIFSIILFIETVVLAIFLFKFLLVKKEFKRKKIIYGMIGLIVLIMTFSTASAWMIIDRKVKTLPNWQELAFGDIQIFDNDKLISEDFDKQASIITDTSSLIGPVTIKYDLSLFESNEEKKGFKVNKYIWTFGDEVIEELNPIIIKTFEEKWNYEISLIVEEVDLKGEIIEKVVENIPNISVSHIVNIEEKTVSNGWKIVSFDANDLQNLWKLEWYFKDDLQKPVWEGYEFSPAKVFFEETLVGLYIKKEWEEQGNLDKVFVIKSGTTSDISWEIISTPSIQNSLEYELKVSNPENSFGEWFIEEFEWKIGEKTVVKKADPTDLEWSSTIDFTFDSFGEQEISVILKDGDGNLKEITSTIDIAKTLELRTSMRIYNEWELMEDVRYEKANNEYYLDDVWVPTMLRFDARLVRPKNLIYSLTEVSWDLDGDKWIDYVWKSFETPIDIEGDHTIIANYKFTHRQIKDDIINLQEAVYIQWIKKEAVLNLNIETSRDYVPVSVRFDASKSYIKDNDIVKFIYDYGDGIVEERDAINPWHTYTEPGDYEVKLTVVSQDWKRYSLNKSLILKPQPQEAQISVSLKKAPTLQWIDFSSEDSAGQITGYFWDFWDGNNSTNANPSHSYWEPGTYTVKLKVDFINSNSLEDEIEIEIYE